MEKILAPTNYPTLVARHLAMWTCLSMAIGCSDGRPPVYAAGGIVKLTDGALLTGGGVSFLPEEGEHRISARAQVGPDGRFTLTTFQTGDGAVAGRHRVIVTAPLGGDREGQDASKPQLDSRFANYETSTLEFVVSEDAAKNQFEIVVDRAPQ